MKSEVIKILLSLIIFVVALVAPINNELITNSLFVISYIIVGLEIVLRAVKNILKGEVFDEHFLMSVATLGAFAIGEFPEAVAVMLFYQVGELFQEYAVDKSRESITKLMDIRPDYANVCRNEKIEKVNPEEVKIGEIIIVKPGEKIPLDGKVIEGETTLDTKALTGEALPREITVGETVLSGCINLSGVIKIEVAKEFGESTVSKILDLVENASNKKSKSENFITKFAKYYTPTVVIIAVILAIVPPFVFNNETFAVWVYRALSFLVVSCPCALVISIPLSFFAGIGGASRLGVLIKGSNYLEALSNTKTMVFDKTGTLTKGVFEVQKIQANQISESELLEMVAYTEYYSNHPVAKSVKTAYNNSVDESRISNTKELSGLGIEAVIDGKTVLVGNEKLMNERKIEFEKAEEIGTILYVAVNGEYKGYILISDTIKEDSTRAIKGLKEKGIRETIILSGDRKNVAEDVANKLGVDKVYAELLPDGKVEKLEELLSKNNANGKVAFVGDGINDAPVLALADVGIAMGGVGADSAIEAADIVIMRDEPSKIISAIKVSRKTMRIVKENIVFAISVKLAVLVLAALGISTMWEAVFADVGVSVIAVLNALRALKTKNM